MSIQQNPQDEMRQQFERVAILVWRWHQPRLVRLPDGEYANERTKYAWDGFQAGSRYQREQDALICDDQGREWDSDEVVFDKNYAAYCASVIRSGGSHD